MIRFHRCSLVALAMVMAKVLVLVRVTKAQEYRAVVEYGEGISPRHFLGSPPTLMKRDGNMCALGSHSCVEVGGEGLCCPDTQYCYVNSAMSVGCCDLLSPCDNICSVSQYLCNITATTSGKASTSSACCQRPCDANAQYQCASSLGGYCCGLSSTCASGKVCIPPASQPTTLLSILPSGCITGQSSCAASLGGGCCDSAATCITSDTNLLCSSSANPTGLRTGSIRVNDSSGLSTAAKAGLGAGLGIGACLAVAIGLWYCMGRQGGSHGARTSQNASVSGRQEMTSEPVVNGSQAVRPRGVSAARDYFGPNAVVGPYTEQSSGGTTPLRGVPVSPENPGDIVPPVEIDGNSREHSNVTSPGELSEMSTDYLKVALENTEGRVEMP